MDFTCIWQSTHVLKNRVKHLIDKKPKHYQDTRVMLMIDFNYWYSAEINKYTKG
jgi:hypothetical protein